MEESIMSGQSKMNPQDQTGVLITAGSLGALMLLIKVAKYLPMVLLGLFFGMILSGTWGLKASLKTKALTLLTNLLVPFGLTILIFGFPTTKHVYWGIFEYQWGNDLFHWGAVTYNHLIETGHLFAWIKKLLKINSLSTVDVQLYLLRIFLIGILAQFGFIYLNFLSHGALSTNFLSPIASRSYGLWKPVLNFLFLSSLRKTENPNRFLKKIGISGFILLLGVINFEVFSDILPMYKALALPCFFLPLLGKFISHFSPPLAESILDASERPQKKEGEILIGHKIGNPLEPVYLTKANLNYHVQLIGGSGAGKTTLIQVIMKKLIHLEMGIIFIDLKADSDTISWIQRETQEAGRSSDLELICLTKHQISRSFNPLQGGSPQEVLAQIMNSFEWSEPFYRAQGSRFLSDIISVLDELKRHSNIDYSLADISDCANDIGRVKELATHPALSPESNAKLLKLIQVLESKDGLRDIAGLSVGLKNLITSSAGPLLDNKDLKRQSVSIKETIEKGRINYFLLNSMADKESCVITGKLILQNIIRVVGQIYDEVPENQRKPCLLIVDEFASFATDNFIDLLNRARGAKLGIMVAHQSRGDLMKVSPTFCDQLERNCNTKLIFGTDSPDDAEYFASMAGTRNTQKSTVRYKRGLLWDQNTGEKSVRDTEEFVVHPNQIRQLGQGQVLKISRLKDRGTELVNVTGNSETTHNET
jgi:hypothetical protein